MDTELKKEAKGIRLSIIVVCEVQTELESFVIVMLFYSGA